MMEELKKLVAGQATGRPLDPDIRAKDMNLILGRNLCYIAVGIAMEGDRVLLIQECFHPCRGQWYLPAGKVDANETIVGATKREFVEESGLTFEPEALVAVECDSYEWVRFTFTGRITGGKLKTPAQEDEESIQAGWFPVESVLQAREPHPMRGRDILPLIKLARRWYMESDSAGGQLLFTGVPAPVGHVSSSLRIVAVYTNKSNVHVLVLKQPNGSTYLPTCLLRRRAVFVSTIQQTLKSCGCEKEFKTRGILTVEHLGNPKGTYDGMCLTVVVQLTNQQLAAHAQTHWVRVEDEECAKRLRAAAENEFACARLEDLAYY